MTIGILQCGELPEALRAQHGSYGAMVAGLVQPRPVTIYDVTQADAAIASYAEPDDRARLADWIGRYLACRPAERAK